MKVAVPVFRGRISPVFDWARWLLVVERGGAVSTPRDREPFPRTPKSFPRPRGFGIRGAGREAGRRVSNGGGGETARGEIEIGGIAPAFRGRRLAELGVQVLLCGGISAPVAGLVESQGIRVMAGLVGEVDAVLDAFFAGRLPDPAFAMPGWRCFGPGMGGGRRWKHRRGRSGGGGRGRGRMPQ